MSLVPIAAVSAGLFAAMAVAWAVQRGLGNAGWIDTIWTVALGLAGTAYALLPAPGIAWPGLRQLVVAALVAAWSLRLALHIAERTLHLPEDARYAQLRRDWGAACQRRLFVFAQLQAAASACLALSIFAASRSPRPFGWPDLVALALLATALAGEAAADAQLRRFRADPANRGGVCAVGLWRLSRHPNYFFEWLGWLAYPLFAIGSSWGWIAVSGPLAMYWLLVHVSGIPPLEAHMLRSRGDAYRDYQARTRKFVPLPR